MRRFLVFIGAVVIGGAAMALDSWTGWLIFAAAAVAGYLVGVTE